MYDNINEIINLGGFNMKVNGVGPSNIVNLYNENKNKISKKSEVFKSDSVQISSEGRSLSNLSVESSNVNISDPKRVETVRNQIEQGTYKPNSKLIAQKMLDAIKGSGN
jgi:negative regulator of flagellin synthesis FlgM